MTEYCRLCAEFKESHEIVASISEIEQSLERKLRACCCWTTENTKQNRLPRSVCAICLDRLDKCWLFSQSVQLAQQRLLEIFDEHTVDTPEIVSSIKIENEFETETETEVVEIEAKPIAMEMEQIAYAYSDNSNELPSPQIDAEPAPRPKAKKKPKAKEIIEMSESNKIDPTKTSVNEKEHQCPMCEKYFQRRWNLTEHIQRHSNDRPFECWLCHKTFPLKYALKEHLVIHVLSPKARRDIQMKRKREKLKPKNVKRTMYNCVECSKIFRHKSSMKEHLETKHSNIYSFECWLCHKISKTRRLLRSHLKVHIQRRVGMYKNKPNQNCICELCGKTFNQRGRLNDHLQCAHSDQRPFKCDICGMGYKMKRSLKSHQITHMEFQHKCTQCEKAFRKKSSLTKHMEYHTGSVAKPFVCDFCGKGFRFNANYAEHRRIHTGETPYNCEYCELKFRTMSSFYTHLKKAHGIAKSVLNIEQRARITAMSTSMVRQPPEIPK